MSTLVTSLSLSLATPENVDSSETDILSDSLGEEILMKGALFELSIVRVSSAGIHSSITPLQKSESEAQILNVYSATILGCPLKSQVHVHEVPPDTGVTTWKLGPSIWK